MPARNLDHARIETQFVAFEAMICLRPSITGFLRCAGAGERSFVDAKQTTPLRSDAGITGCKRPENAGNAAGFALVEKFLLMHQQACLLVNAVVGPRRPRMNLPVVKDTLIMNESACCAGACREDVMPGSGPAQFA